MLGRVLWFQGAFAESLVHLERARKTVEQRKDLIFDEDLRDLICDLADTLRELDDPATAEHHLRAEIERRDKHCISPLHLSTGIVSSGGLIRSRTLRDRIRYRYRRRRQARWLRLYRSC